jgi:hypothetical protein
VTDTPMNLIRKLEETSAALLDLSRRVRRAAEGIADPALPAEMTESADGWERRAQEMADAILRWKREIN